MSQSITLKRMLESQDVVSPNQSSLPFVSWGARVAIGYNITPDEHGKPTVSPQRLVSPSFLTQKNNLDVSSTCYVVMTSSGFSRIYSGTSFSGLVFSVQLTKSHPMFFFLTSIPRLKLQVYHTFSYLVTVILIFYQVGERLATHNLDFNKC